VPRTWAERDNRRIINLLENIYCMKKLLFIGVFCCKISLGQTTYTFNGNGNWSDSANWLNKNIPPDILMDSQEIIIDPIGGSCILDIPQYISANVKLTIATGKSLILLDKFEQVNRSDSFKMPIDDIMFLDSISANPSAIPVFKPIQKTLSVESKKDDIISTMIQYAQELSGKKANGKAPELHADEGINKPAHYGLAYRYGGEADNKNISERLRPTNGDATHKLDYVFGTDCEGFLVNLIRKANIAVSAVGATDFAWKLNLQLQQTSNTNYNDIRLDSLGHLASSNLKNGDIIQWKRDGLHHIGIIYIDVNQHIWVYNSNGNPYPETPPFSSKCTSKECEQTKNRGNTRGVHAVDFSDPFWLNKSNWQNTYDIFRFENVGLTTVSPTSNVDGTSLSGGNTTYSGANKIISKGVCWSEKQKPSIKNNSNKTNDGNGIGNFTSNIPNLVTGKTYFIRAYVTVKNSEQDNDQGVTYYGNEISFTPNKTEESTFTDPRDGQVYTYKQIGSQIWMTQNLNYAAPGSWCHSNVSTNCEVYGRLYDWNTALTVAPPGWHLPSDAEWTTLTNYLGGSAVAGGKMKEAGTEHWIGNTGGDNSSGFTGLPGGSMVNGRVNDPIKYYGDFWTSTPSADDYAWIRYLYYNSAQIEANPNAQKTAAVSVRCVKD